MGSYEDYLQLARRVTSFEFAQQHPGKFLVKRPSASKIARGAPASLPFKTSFAATSVDPFASDWLVLPIAKKEGNPYPDRISIGRTPNCDIVLRVPFISKVHAHFLQRPDGSLALKDNKASNPTRVNQRPLAPNTEHPLALGDTITFVSMEFVLVDAFGLHELLRKPNKSD